MLYLSSVSFQKIGLPKLGTTWSTLCDEGDFRHVQVAVAVFVAEEDVDGALEVMRSQAVSAGSLRVGTVYARFRRRYGAKSNRRQSCARYALRRTAAKNLLRA